MVSEILIKVTRKPNCRWQTRATRKHAKNSCPYCVVTDNTGLSSFV